MVSETQINTILERNKRVEQDKAWETSKTRRGIIAFLTYIVVVYFLVLIEAPNPYLNALVPTGAYLISTLSFPFIKEFWIKKAKK